MQRVHSTFDGYVLCTRAEHTFAPELVAAQAKGRLVCGGWLRENFALIFMCHVVLESPKKWVVSHLNYLRS